jgi:putative ABC transport system permease protein
MLQNYLKIALRNLLRNKVYSFINIAGLALGLTVSMLILLFVSHEVSFDKFHAKADKIFSILGENEYDGMQYTFNDFSAKLGPILKENNSQVLNYTRLREYNFSKTAIQNPKESSLKFAEKHFMFAEPSFFELFDFKFIKGNRKLALTKPFSMVITERIAKKYFGNKNPIGQTLVYNIKHTFEIMAVVENPPSNSTLQFDIIASLNTYPKLSADDKMAWEMGGAFQTYLLLDSPKSASKVSSTILQCGNKAGAFDSQAKYSLQQFSREHLHGYYAHMNSSQYVKIFSIIAILILLLALFNYMSLASARATIRAKEVGIRKVVGANRKGLIKQFYLESLLMCLISFGFGFVLVELFRQPFYDLLGLQIDPSFLFNPLYVSILIALFVFSAFVAGSYPAIVLSGFAPIEVIKGKYSNQSRGAMIRKGLMIFQFTVSVTLIIATFITQKQLNLIQNKDLGFHKDQILTIQLPEELGKDYITFRNEIAQQTGVENVTASGTQFFKGYNSWSVKHKKTGKDVNITTLTGDAQFANVFDLAWKIPPIDKKLSGKLYLNQLAVSSLGIIGNPVGQTLKLGDKTSEIGGVLKNFDYNGSMSKLEPMMLIISGDKFTENYAGGVMYVKLNPKTDIKEKVSILKYIFEKYHTNKPFDYYFLDDAFHETFSLIEKMSNMFLVFMSLAIFIACLGLFGLVTFIAEQKTKEIGIRKVLGASVTQIVQLLSKDFLKLVLIAIVIASPIAYYFMQKWLQDFAYRIEISWWIFVLAGVVAIVIALLTVSYQAIRAALANPVKSLRTE